MDPPTDRPTAKLLRVRVFANSLIPNRSSSQRRQSSRNDRLVCLWTVTNWVYPLPKNRVLRFVYRFSRYAKKSKEFLPTAYSSDRLLSLVCSQELYSFVIEFTGRKIVTDEQRANRAGCFGAKRAITLRTFTTTVESYCRNSETIEFLPSIRWR